MKNFKFCLFNLTLVFFQNSFTGTRINVEGGKAREIDVQAEKHHGESEGTHAAKPNQLGPGKAQCDWSVSLKNMPRFSEVQWTNNS